MTETTGRPSLKRYIESVGESFLDRLPAELLEIIEEYADLEKYAVRIQRAYRRIRFMPKDFPGFRSEGRGWFHIRLLRYAPPPPPQRCVIYTADPAIPGEVAWRTGYVKRAPGRDWDQVKYAALVILEDGPSTREEYYYSTPELRQEARSKHPKLGLIIGVFLIR
jgi:hypothetical protein